jgi:hypothetical protein
VNDLALAKITMGTTGRFLNDEMAKIRVVHKEEFEAAIGAVFYRLLHCFNIAVILLKILKIVFF